jgi:NADP-dependent 3-hydroxy acid dehydrogenase YdfG
MADSRVFVITGASSGIGAATAVEASRRGHRLVLGARREEALEEIAARCEGETLTVPVDVTSWEQNERLAEAAMDRFGAIDIVFANAGFGGKRSLSREGDSPEHWREMVLTNVLGAAYTVRATFEAVVAAKGHFLLTGSVAGRAALPGSLYSSTKWAVTGMGQSLRGELAGTGVRVTLIEPGMVDTPFFDSKPADDVLTDVDIAQAVLWAISQPERVDVNEILVRPTSQAV